MKIRETKIKTCDLIEASLDAPIEYIRLLLRRRGVNVNYVNSEGDTAIMNAVKANRLDVVKLLIQHNADVNYKDNNGNTPIMKAISYDHYNLVQYFIKIHANINLSNNGGWTPLMMAVYNQNLEIVETLINAGANINNVNTIGRSCIDIAQEHIERSKFYERLYTPNNKPNLIYATLKNADSK